MKNKLKFFRVFHSKKAQMAVAQAIKVITSIVLGAAILVGGVATVSEVVLPNTTDKVESMFSYEGGDGLGGGSISDNIESDSTLNHSGVIPEGGTYYVGVISKNLGSYTGATAIYTSDSDFPDTISVGDVYVYGDYEYRYNQYADVTNSPDIWSDFFRDESGWGVIVSNTSKTEYGEILESINGVPVINMTNTFNNCASLTIAPKIPNGVTNIRSAFQKCISLTTAPIIPDSVTDMGYTFYGCTSLTAVPKISNNTIDMSHTFYGCTSFNTAPEIPNSVIIMSSTFYGCTSLTTAPIIPDSVTDMGYTFYGCTSLTAVPKISNNVTIMSSTFANCTLLTMVPTIPDSVQYMGRAFYGCSSLMCEIEINANPAYFKRCFENTRNTITLIGSSAMLDEIAATANNNNVTVA